MYYTPIFGVFWPPKIEPVPIFERHALPWATLCGILGNRTTTAAHPLFEGSQCVGGVSVCVVILRVDNR